MITHTYGPKHKCLLSNSENRDIICLINISRILILYWPITIKFRIYASIPSKPQNHKLITVAVCGFSYLAPYWLISRYTITFHQYFWFSRFCEFHSNAVCYNDNYFQKRKFKLVYSLFLSVYLVFSTRLFSIANMFAVYSLWNTYVTRHGD